LKENELFDAVITDPPYGIRAPSRKSGKKKKNKQKEEVDSQDLM
jgi:tRNA G10  N-methylase Trm11